MIETRSLAAKGSMANSENILAIILEGLAGNYVAIAIKSHGSWPINKSIQNSAFANLSGAHGKDNLLSTKLI